MLTFDASSMIYAWDNYPIENFPSLWAWLAEEMNALELQMSYVAFEEVENTSPECAAWLRTAGLHIIPVSAEITVEANRIKTILGIVGDAYRSGVGENDLLIIATARLTGCPVVSNEALQPSQPQVMANYKIPLVCDHGAVTVPCRSFLDYLKASRRVIG